MAMTMQPLKIRAILLLTILGIVSVLHVDAATTTATKDTYLNGRYSSNETMNYGTASVGNTLDSNNRTVLVGGFSTTGVVGTVVQSATLHIRATSIEGSATRHPREAAGPCARPNLSFQ